jgi:hypothetical protein
MQDQTAVVITSIAYPTEAVRKIADHALATGTRFFLIGDVPSPKDFSQDGCDFYSLERQASLDLAFAQICPKRHYARKNIGYLEAIRSGATRILETDDDNIPFETFWTERGREVEAPVFETESSRWVNVYSYFSKEVIWPRGIPLEALAGANPDWSGARTRKVLCPIQQGLADENPDVDAVYRLTRPLPVNFEPDRTVALGRGAWCPFNSQNTVFWPEAYPLLYLPAYCSFRMTDIWRSFVAQRIAWENGWNILFYSSTVIQERNDHSLLRDFADEVPGYLNNAAIGAALDALPIRAGAEHMPDNLRICYEKLVSMKLVGGDELPLLEAWIGDLGGK